MFDSRLRSRLWLAVWLALMVALPVGRYALHAWQEALDREYESEQQRILESSTELERKVDDWINGFYEANHRDPTLVELAKQFNHAVPLQSSSSVPGEFDLVDRTKPAAVSIYVQNGECRFASRGYRYGTGPLNVEKQTTLATLWLSRVGDLLLITILIWMWLNRSTLSQPRTAWWGWRLAGLAFLMLNLAICAIWESRFEAGIGLDLFCFEPLVPALVLFLLPAICLRSFPLDLEWRCEKCDYSLKGNVSGICPECGNPIPLKAGAGKSNQPNASSRSG